MCLMPSFLFPPRIPLKDPEFSCCPPEFALQWAKCHSCSQRSVDLQLAAAVWIVKVTNPVTRLIPLTPLTGVSANSASWTSTSSSFFFFFKCYGETTNQLKQHSKWQNWADASADFMYLFRHSLFLKIGDLCSTASVLFFKVLSS